MHMQAKVYTSRKEDRMEETIYRGGQEVPLVVMGKQVEKDGVPQTIRVQRGLKCRIIHLPSGGQCREYSRDDVDKDE